jgi:ubiquinone/menaquinone biosynthesis C-methylase UbiE
MVYAVDTASGMLHHLRQRLREEGISNVRTMKVPPHDPLLVDGSIDVAFVCNTYHHIEDREVYLRKIRKALKPDGRIIIIEFNKEGDIPVGPPSQMRLSKDSVRKELQAAGLSVTETPVSLPYRYMLMAQTTG